MARGYLGIIGSLRLAWSHLRLVLLSILEKFYNNVFTSLNRSQKKSIFFIVDAIMVVISFIFAFILRLDNITVYFFIPYSWAILISALITVLVLNFFGLYKTVVRFVTFQVFRTVSIGAAASAISFYIICEYVSLFLPRSVPFIYYIVASIALGGVRFLVRWSHRKVSHKDKKPVIIYGAGAAGQQLLNSLRLGPEYNPVCFVDDADELQGRVVGGLEVRSPSSLHDDISKYHVEAVLLAMPSASRVHRKSIVDRLEQFSVRVQTIPGMADIVAGRAKIDQFLDVPIEELLGRDPVEPDQGLLSANIAGKAVMVTGAGGSIGSELCRQIITLRPRRLVLLEKNEFNLYSINQELVANQENGHLAVEIVPLLGSVADRIAISATLRAFQIETVYHAAAYKHVPMVEHNVVEGVRNNVFGTRAIAQAAVDAGVRVFVLISTDKAVRPTNIMGATKRAAELICQALARAQSQTVFSMVRFGNVLGSSGSVIPLFRQQIANGGPITVTHPEITRFFMLTSEAVQLVIQAGAMARGGEVFVLDMGAPVRIVEMARRMARLSGLTPYVAADVPGQGAPLGEDLIEIVFTGLRPGEKLYEELLIGGDTTPTAHPRILSANEICLDWSDIESLLLQLEDACERRSIPEIRELFEMAPTGYRPADSISDLTWKVSGRIVKEPGDNPQPPTESTTPVSVVRAARFACKSVKD